MVQGGAGASGLLRQWRFRPFLLFRLLAIEEGAAGSGDVGWHSDAGGRGGVGVSGSFEVLRFQRSDLQGRRVPIRN